MVLCFDVKFSNHFLLFFQERYRLPGDHDDPTLTSKAQRCFHHAAYRLVKDMISNARIQAVCLYYKKFRGQKMNKKLGASKIYLTEAQYREVKPNWLKNKCDDAYAALCAWWASDEFQQASNSKRVNREAGGPVLHSYGADGHIRLAKRMVK